MSFYHDSLVSILQERIAYFKSAGLSKEAELLQARLKIVEDKSVETSVEAIPQNGFQNSVAERVRENLRAKLTAETSVVPELERQFILDSINRAKTLKECSHLRHAYIDRLLKINRAARNEKIKPDFVDMLSGPYNNEKTFSEALQLIYSQDPLWIEDLKELYFSIMPLSSATAASKSPL